MEHKGKETGSSNYEESLIRIVMDDPDNMPAVNINSNILLILPDSQELKIENNGEFLRCMGWSTPEMNIDFLAINKTLCEWMIFPCTPESSSQSGDTKCQIECYVQYVTVADDVSISLMKPLPEERPQPYWWNDEIAVARIECIQKRRRLTRLRGKGDMDTTAIALNDYRSARRDLKHLIRESKASGWNEMVQYVENDPTP